MIMGKLKMKKSRIIAIPVYETIVNYFEHLDAFGTVGQKVRQSFGNF